MNGAILHRSAGLVMVVLVLALAGCQTTQHVAGQPTVVATTTVWADIARTIAGPDAAVTTLIGDPTVDPHSHETSASESVRIRDAGLVIYNGAGYDEFARKALANGQRAVCAFDHRDAAIRTDQNEHVWYDIPTVADVADVIATQLGQLDPQHMADYTDRAHNLRNRLDTITAITRQIAATHPQAPVLATEPVAHYLLQAADTLDLTPLDYQQAIEQQTDPAPETLAKLRDLLRNHQVKALIYNAQTDDSTTRALRASAGSAQVPVVTVTEALPAKVDFVTWQEDNARALAAALG